MSEYAIIGLMLGSTAMSAINQAKQAKETQALYQQRAAVAEGEAEAVTKATEHQKRERLISGKRDVARAKVLFAKSGVRPKTGTAGAVAKEIEKEYLKDIAFIQEGGAVEASRLRSGAGIERQMGASAYRAGLWDAGTTVMRGLGTTGMFAYQAGTFSKKKKLTSQAKATYLRY